MWNVYYGYLLASKLGWFYFIEISITYVIIYGFTKLETLLKNIRDEKSKKAKENTSLLSEVFNNIKMIKLYGW